MTAAPVHRSVTLADGRSVDVPVSNKPDIQGKPKKDDRWWLALLLISAADLIVAEEYWRERVSQSYEGLIDGDGWRFDAATQKYLRTKPFRGPNPSDSDIRAEMLAVLTSATDDLKANARKLTRGKMPLDQWQAAQARTIKSLYIASAAAGVGGTANLTDADKAGIVGNVGGHGLADGLSRLGKFGEQLETGEAGPTEQIINRAGLYASPAHAIYEEARRWAHSRVKIGDVAVMWQEMNVLDQGANHCRPGSYNDVMTCPQCTNAGWQELGSLPLPGDRQCGPACRCRMVYRVKPPMKLEDVKPADFDKHNPMMMSARNFRRVALADGRLLVLAADDEEGGEWRTINGAHVLIKDGKIAKGPAHLIGKSPEGVAAHGKSAPVNKAKPGYHRIERDAAGNYVGTHGPDGKVSQVAEHAERLKGLKISPGYTSIHLAEDPAAMRQAYQTDSKGRETRVYSAAHHAKQSAAKFARVKKFVAKLPEIREAIANHPSHEAAALRLIDATGIRIGSNADTGADKKAFGASTLSAEHVVQTPEGKTALHFTGKKGVEIHQEINNDNLANDLKTRAKGGGKLYNTSDAKVRDFLHSVAPGFKVKDFRTAVAADVAMDAIKSAESPTRLAELVKARKAVGEKVAARLGNTASVALKSYIPPEVFSGWETKAANLEQAKAIESHAKKTGLDTNAAAKDWITNHAVAFRENFNKKLGKSPAKGESHGPQKEFAASSESEPDRLVQLRQLCGRADEVGRNSDTGNGLRPGRRGGDGNSLARICALSDDRLIPIPSLALSAPKPYLAKCPQCRSHDVARTANVAGGRSLDRCRHCGHKWTSKPFVITAEQHSPVKNLHEQSDRPAFASV